MYISSPCGDRLRREGEKRKMVRIYWTIFTFIATVLLAVVLDEILMLIIL